MISRYTLLIFVHMHRRIVMFGFSAKRNLPDRQPARFRHYPGHSQMVRTRTEAPAVSRLPKIRDPVCDPEEYQECRFRAIGDPDQAAGSQIPSFISKIFKAAKR